MLYIVSFLISYLMSYIISYYISHTISYIMSYMVSYFISIMLNSKSSSYLYWNPEKKLVTHPCTYKRTYTCTRSRLLYRCQERVLYAGLGMDFSFDCNQNWSEKKEGKGKLNCQENAKENHFLKEMVLLKVEENDSNDTLVLDDDAHKVNLRTRCYFFCMR